MSDKPKRQRLVTVLGVLYWIVLPALLYLAAGTQALIAFMVLSVAAVAGTALVVRRA